MDKPHILAQANETVFYLLKEPVPIISENKISAVQCKRKVPLIPLSTPVSSR
jgi:hypothetical protein